MVGDVVQGGPGDDLIDLGYDERQQTFGSAQRDRLSYKGSAFRVIVTLGSPKGRGHARGRRPRPDRPAPLPRPPRLGQGRRAHRVDVRRPDPRPRRRRPHRRRRRPRRPGRRPDRRRASATTCWWAASAATRSRRTAAATSSTAARPPTCSPSCTRRPASVHLAGGPGADLLTVGGAAGRGSCVNADGGAGRRRAGADGGRPGPSRQGRRRPEGRRVRRARQRRRRLRLRRRRSRT